MYENIKKLEEWENKISEFPKLDIYEARKLCGELNRETDSKKREMLKKDLIHGTLHVVVEFIRNSCLIYVNSSTYDMNDIINECNEIWIRKVNEGVLYRTRKFKWIFDREFYKLLIEGLGIQRYPIQKNTPLSVNTFAELLIRYEEEKQINPQNAYNSFLFYLECFHPDLFLRCKKEEYKNTLPVLFDAIINSFDGNFTYFNKTDLDKFKYILINNGLEYLRPDINNIVCEDVCENVCESYYEESCKKELVDFVLSLGYLTDREKNVIIKRYGLLGEDCNTLAEIGKLYGLCGGRIGQIEARAIRKLRCSKGILKFRPIL